MSVAKISIHAAREGGDVVRMLLISNRQISIHAAREGGDCIPVYVPFGVSADFNPRRP